MSLEFDGKTCWIFVGSAEADSPYNKDSKRLIGGGMVAATTRDEALGKAIRIAEKVWPRRNGWHDHLVSIVETTVYDTEEDFTGTPNPFVLDLVKKSGLAG